MDYGLTESQRQRHFPEVRSAMASTGNKLLELLEHSLDNEAFPGLALAALITLMASFPSRADLRECALELMGRWAALERLCEQECPTVKGGGRVFN
ncbi:hypothetical protein [Zoogloea sp.]|uniref:hypothetical protein n=1 Tax=Zoogloea sp. TaxID=49181 RepID=UPI0035AFCD36